MDCAKVARQHLASSGQAAHLRLRFFDLDLEIWSDSGQYLSDIARMYHRFRVETSSPLEQPDVEFLIISSPKNGWGRPVVIFDQQVWSLPPADYFSDILFKAYSAGAQGYLLFHAGAVSSHNQGVIIAADSFHGKTTLVLELVRRGFKFLTDESAVLGRADRLIHPFPRSLLVRPGTLDLIDVSPHNSDAPVRAGRRQLDIEQIWPNSLSRPVPLQHLIVLQDPARPAAADPHAQELAVLVDHLPDECLAAIRQLEDAAGVQVVQENAFPLLKLRSARRTRLFAQIEDLCRAHKVLVLNIRTGPLVRPDFSHPPLLEPIPPSEAVLALLPQFQGGHRSVILQEYAGLTSRLFVEMMTLVGQAGCYRLSIGPLQEMAELVQGLVDPVEILAHS